MRIINIIRLPHSANWKWQLCRKIEWKRKKSWARAQENNGHWKMSIRKTKKKTKNNNFPSTNSDNFFCSMKIVRKKQKFNRHNWIGPLNKQTLEDDLIEILIWIDEKCVQNSHENICENYQSICKRINMIARIKTERLKSCTESHTRKPIPNKWINNCRNRNSLNERCCVRCAVPWW